MKSAHKRFESTTSTLDLRTIRERVAAIKRTWTPEEVSARAAEGRQRRCELVRLIEGLDLDYLQSECDCESELTLVG
jgi:hypothetical protein